MLLIHMESAPALQVFPRLHQIVCCFLLMARSDSQPPQSSPASADSHPSPPTADPLRLRSTLWLNVMPGPSSLGHRVQGLAPCRHIASMACHTLESHTPPFANFFAIMTLLSPLRVTPFEPPMKSSSTSLRPAQKYVSAPRWEIERSS